MKKHIGTLILALLFLISISGCKTQPSSQAGQKSERFGILIKVRPEFEERYIILHKHTFPYVLKRIYESNMRNYSIFLLKGTLFSFYEYIGTDYQADMEKIGQDKTTQEWWKLTDPMQEPLENRKEGEWWAEMEEILHHGEKHVPSAKAMRYAYTAELIGCDFQTKFTLPEELKQTGIQNFCIYRKENRLYAYFEYYEKDPDTDREILERGLDDLIMQVSPDVSYVRWSRMEEVFHSD